VLAFARILDVVLKGNPDGNKRNDKRGMPHSSRMLALPDWVARLKASRM